MPENSDLQLNTDFRQIIETQMIAESAAMQSVVQQINLVARIKDYPVLITGETGVGKQEAALYLHEASQVLSRNGSSDIKKRPFVDIHCGALNNNLLESELFGHVRGAFTGAISDKPGRLEVAQGGTLFLDEIGEANMGVQRRLLKFLDTGEIVPLGSVKTKQISTRVVAATHRNLIRAIERGKFREDLFHRLNVFPIHIPALRYRLADIVPLVENCIERFNAVHKTRYNRKLSVDVARVLTAHQWLGNIRELFNVVERALIISQEDKLEVKNIHLDQWSSDNMQEWISNSDEEGRLIIGGPHRLSEISKAHILSVLKCCDYNLARAAKVLGLYRPTLYSKMKKYGIGNFRTSSSAANKESVPKGDSENPLPEETEKEEMPGIDKPDPIAQKLGLLPRGDLSRKINNNN